MLRKERGCIFATLQEARLAIARRLTQRSDRWWNRLIHEEQLAGGGLLGDVDLFADVISIAQPLRMYG